MDFFKIKKNLAALGVLGLVALSFLIYTISTNKPADTPINLSVNESKGILTLAFDDGLKSQHEVAFREMQKYGYKGTLFPIANWTEYFESKELMYFEEAREMQDSGWEIGSHSLTHRKLTSLSLKELEKELKESKENLEKEGFNISSFAFPYGSYNWWVLQETKEYYSASKPMRDGFNSIENPDVYELKSKWALKKHSSEEVCSWIKKANQENLWLILVFHNIYEERTPWEFSEQKFKEVLECINNQGIEVKTIKEVLEGEKGN